jgi:hypothetical protein
VIFIRYQIKLQQVFIIQALVSGGYVKEACSIENSTSADMHNFTGKVYMFVLDLVANFPVVLSFHMIDFCSAGLGTKCELEHARYYRSWLSNSTSKSY